MVYLLFSPLLKRLSTAVILCPPPVSWVFKGQIIGLCSSQVFELRLNALEHSRARAQGAPFPSGPHLQEILDVKFML